MNNSDIMVLTKTTFEAYSKHYVNYFVPIGSYVQEKIGIDESRIKDGYGVLLKNKDENHYLENYISFANEDYYLVFMISSQNLGSALDENNSAHDNALTFTRYLPEGDELWKKKLFEALTSPKKKDLKQEANNSLISSNIDS